MCLAVFRWSVPCLLLLETNFVLYYVHVIVKPQIKTDAKHSKNDSDFNPRLSNYSHSVLSGKLSDWRKSHQFLPSTIVTPKMDFVGKNGVDLYEVAGKKNIKQFLLVGEH